MSPELARHGADAFATVFDYLALTHEIGPSDAIMCFGSRDPHVPQRAAELFHGGVAPLVLTTGGVTLSDGRCEAEVFADELERRGVPRHRIVVERDSGHTGDNVRLGVAALQERHGAVASIVSVAWPFAARRCVGTLARHHPEMMVRSAPAFSRPGERSPFTGHTARRAVEQLSRVTLYAEQGVIVVPEPPRVVTRAAETLHELLAPPLPASSRAPAFSE